MTGDRIVLMTLTAQIAATLDARELHRRLSDSLADDPTLRGALIGRLERTATVTHPAPTSGGADRLIAFVVAVRPVETDGDPSADRHVLSAAHHRIYTALATTGSGIAALAAAPLDRSQFARLWDQVSDSTATGAVTDLSHPSLPL